MGESVVHNSQRLQIHSTLRTQTNMRKVLDSKILTGVILYTLAYTYNSSMILVQFRTVYLQIVLYLCVLKVETCVYSSNGTVYVLSQNYFHLFVYLILKRKNKIFISLKFLIKYVIYAHILLLYRLSARLFKS